jgi:energy-coupling factor transporter transmembrane protein EcfT
VKLEISSPGAGTALLAAAAAVALLTDRLWVVAGLTAALLVVCLRAPASRRWPYLIGALTSGLGVLLISPFLWSSGGGTLLWEGPTIPVLGTIDISTDEIQQAALNGFRLAAVGLAFAAYALLLDHDRLVGSARFARRSALAVALATRLVPTLERDAGGLCESVRGRGVEIAGARGYARLLSPLVAGSLERASCLAEAMEARGFGRPGATRRPSPRWTQVERAAVLVAAIVVGGVALWR